MKKLIYSFALIVVLGCKSTKILKASSGLEMRMPVKKIIKNHTKFQSRFTTLQGRVKVELIQGDRSETHTLTLRMGYDNTIWLNAFLNINVALLIYAFYRFKSSYFNLLIFILL